MSVCVVGELASAHDGDWSKVERLVELCKRVGVNACKLQYWSSADRLADRRHATPAYRAIYHRYQIPRAWLSMFYEECHAQGLEAVCTVYLPEDAPTVAPWVDRLKIASFENEDLSLIRAVRAIKKPWMVSTGMTHWKTARRYGSQANYHTKSPPVVKLLGCVSSYPASIDGALSVRLFDGYSDHTHNIWTGAVAVGAGARILEVHVRLDETDPANPDYATALSPDELRRYVDGVRTAERLLADVPVDESAMRPFKVRPA